MCINVLFCVTEGKTREELMTNVKEAVQAYLAEEVVVAVKKFLMCNNNKLEEETVILLGKSVFSFFRT